MNLQIVNKFHNHYIPIPECGCWIWERSFTVAGYGLLYIGHNKMTYAHRLSWEIHNGPIPKGKHVCHSCDTPSCVNPHHLFLGTHGDNMRDAFKKGRMEKRYHGRPHHGPSKITEQDALKIRSDNRPQKIIAQEYGIGQAAVSMIKSGKRWIDLMPAGAKG